MSWNKLGKIWSPDGTSSWARHSFMTPVPVAIAPRVIRLYGGMRHEAGVSRIGWIDLSKDDPSGRFGRFCEKPPPLNFGPPRGYGF